MENTTKKYNWNDVVLSIGGTEIPIKSIELSSDLPFSGAKYEGTITYLPDDYKRMVPATMKLSNYQKKKAWKKFNKIFGINTDVINKKKK